MRLKFPFCSVVVKMHFELREPDCVLIASITPANKSQAACHGGSCLLQAQAKSCYWNKTISCSTVFLLSHWAKAIVFLIIFTLAAQSFIWVFSLSMTRNHIKHNSFGHDFGYPLWKNKTFMWRLGWKCRTSKLGRAYLLGLINTMWWAGCTRPTSGYGGQYRLRTLDNIVFLHQPGMLSRTANFSSLIDFIRPKLQFNFFFFA